MTIALVTGASSGIGYEIAIILASKGYDLVITARNSKSLADLKAYLESTYGVSVWSIPADLSQPTAAQNIYTGVQKNNLEIDILVNNAGFGVQGHFESAALKQYEEMISVNIMAVVQLTHLFLPGMKVRQSGKILNVASLAAFQPGPNFSVYFASKSFVLSFSEALYVEAKPSGIVVCALCPGFTQSRFFEKADVVDVGKIIPIPTAKQVATYGVKKLLDGKAVAIYGIFNRVIATLSQLLPRKWTRYTAKWFNNFFFRSK